MAYYTDHLEEPNFFMMDYYSYKSGLQDQDSQTLVYLKMENVYDEDRKDEFVGRIQTWLLKCIKKIRAQHPGREIVFGFAPGHSPSSPDSFMITELDVNSLFQDPNFSVKPKLLKRIVKVPKQATGGCRNVETHLHSIKVTKDLTNKIVCIMDDVRTTGCTLAACRQLVKDSGATQIYTLAIGQTVPEE